MDELFENQPDEFDDVQLIDCGRDTKGRGVAGLEITNDSSKRSSYFITVEFRGTATMGSGSRSTLSRVWTRARHGASM